MSGTKENRRDQIDRYVNKEMEEGEILTFEQRMRENAELAHAVHMHKDVLRGIEYHYMNELKAKLIASDQPRKKGLSAWAIAALVALGLVATAAAFYFLR